MLSPIVAAGVVTMMVNGTPIEATYLHSTLPGCVQSKQTARTWRSENQIVVEQAIGPWCVAGTVIDHYWVAEQWAANEGVSAQDNRAIRGTEATHKALPKGVQATGWRIRIPLSALQKRPTLTRSDWGIDLVDSSINTRFRFRQSPLGLEHHHRKSLTMSGQDEFRASHVSTFRGREGALQHPVLLTRKPDGGVLLSGRTQRGESFSALIERGVNR